MFAEYQKAFTNIKDVVDASNKKFDNITCKPAAKSNKVMEGAEVVRNLIMSRQFSRTSSEAFEDKYEEEHPSIIHAHIIVRLNTTRLMQSVS